MSKRNTTWGRWTLNTSNWTLVHCDNYEVGLEQMKTSDEVLDWICHLTEKVDMTREDIGYFVTALSEMFYHLPNKFSNGKTVNPTALLQVWWGGELSASSPRQAQ